MNTNITFSKERPADWDSWNNAVCSSSPYYQSSGYAHVLYTKEKTEPYYIRLLIRGRVAGQALLLKRYYYDQVKQKKKVPFPYFESVHGPVFAPDVSDADIAKVFKYINMLALKHLATHVRLIPPYFPGDRVMPEAAIKSCGYAIQKWGTYFLDLERSTDAIFKNFSCKVRNTIRKADKKGACVKKIESWEEYCDLYVPTFNMIKETTAANRFAACHEDWTENVAQGAHYYLTMKDDQPLACLGVQTMNKGAHAFGYGIAPEAMKQGIPAQDALHWEAIKEASDLGLKYFDFAGVNPAPGTPKEEGIRFFKKKWGGEYREYPICIKDLIPFRQDVSKYIKRILSGT
ncbi:lipid II:glycine glycyltransferase FemX [Maridesulfovibrio sp.]|uniref:lipid II:glycine glycyltransferase FemX n=1 Tax=Maridesulfovibrio sp. TaxID=2795000 RepID=UPI003B001F11